MKFRDGFKFMGFLGFVGFIGLFLPLALTQAQMMPPLGGAGGVAPVAVAPVVVPQVAFNYIPANLGSANGEVRLEMDHKGHIFITDNSGYGHFFNIEHAQNGDIEVYVNGHGKQSKSKRNNNGTYTDVNEKSFDNQFEVDIDANGLMTIKNSEGSHLFYVIHHRNGNVQVIKVAGGLKLAVNESGRKEGKEGDDSDANTNSGNSVNNGTGNL